VADRLERLTNLIAVLLDTGRPLTLEEIADRVPGYPDEPGTRRRQFERDKSTLRDIGVPISLEALYAFDHETGYRIHRSEYELPPLDLTDDERVALHLAVTAVGLEGGEGRHALWKLGGAEGTGAAPLAALPSVPALPLLFDAYRRRAEVRFTYRGEPRRLWPYGVVFRNGHWYTVGHDADRDAIRAFRADRIEGDVDLGDPGTFDPPTGFDPSSALRDEPWRFGDEEPVEARVRVAAPHATWVVAEVGDQAVESRDDDGSVVLRMAVTNRAAFRSFVLGLLDAAEVIGPPELRAEMVEWLESLATPPRKQPATKAQAKRR
jgi:predicted DNA-binding transcriptional regulator YafY